MANTLQLLTQIRKAMAGVGDTTILAYKYMGLFGAQFNSLIQSAERL